MSGFDLAGRTVKLDSGVLATLRRGQVVVTPRSAKGGGMAIDAIGWIDAPSEAVWPVVRDAEHFAQFIPRTKASEIRGTDGDARITYVEVEMPFPLKNLWSEVRSLAEDLGDGAHRRTWTLVRGSYKFNEGGWFVHPVEGGTVLGYHLDIALKIPVPEKVLRKAQTKALPDMFAAIRKRVASR